MILHIGKDPLQCYICDAMFTKRTDMTFHIGTVHEGKTPQVCTICDMKFTEPKILKNHVAKVHRPHNCSQCGATFNEKYKFLNAISNGK